MEDPDSEWKILEYNYSSSSKKDVVKRILTNGYVIGKEIVITGIVITSAPLVVPPLVIFSTVGVAVSVPFGVLFASYACTNKLMSMLLSTPPPILLEYFSYTDDDEFDQENDERVEISKLGFDDYEDDAEVEGYVTDKEDNEQVEEYVNQGVIETETGYIQEGGTLIANTEMEDDMLQREREEIDYVKQGVEMRPSFGDAGEGGDRGYEEDVGEYLVIDDGSLEEPLDDSNDAYEDAKLRGEGMVGNTVEDDYINVSESASNVVFGDVKDVEMPKPVTSVSASSVAFGDVEDVETTEPVTSVISASNNEVFGDDKDVETTKPVTVIEIESEKLVEKGSKNEEPVGEMRHVVILSDGNEENNYNSRVIDELDLVAREVVGDAKKGKRNIESDEKVLRESMGTREKNDNDASKDDGEDAILKTLTKERLIRSNADARGIRDGKLLDEKKNNNLESFEVGNEVKENADNDNVDALTHAPSKHNVDDAKVACKKMLSRGENLDEEKIWEKIAAMRRIVGYKAPSQPTCTRELKALYVFTGVEPPASFEGDSDLDAKLKFLMAIVGVK